MNNQNKQNILKQFKENYQTCLNSNTFSEYLSIIGLILDNKLIIKSKSRYNQVKSVLNKCAAIGISLDYNLIPFSKKDNAGFKRNIIDKLIDEKDFNQIINALPNSKKGNELRLACQISYYSGLRLSECLNLKPSDIKINGHIRIEVIGKGNKFGVSYLPKTDYFLNSLNNFNEFSINVPYVETTLKRVSKKLNISFTFHSFRHSFAKNMVEKGIKLNRLQKLLRHSNISTTSRYLELSDDVDDFMLSLGY